MPPVRILPATLSETQYLGPTRAPRIIKVVLPEATIQVSANSGPPITPGSFSWNVPHVPLSALSPLLEQLAPCVQRALPGFSWAPYAPLGWTLTQEADAELSVGDRIIHAFYQRWTGQPYPGYTYARCAKCGKSIVHSVNGLLAGRWAVRTSDDEEGDTFYDFSCDGPHEPHTEGPYMRHILYPGHLLNLEANGTAWTGACECRGWNGEGSDWRDVFDAHYLHAAAPAPGAPFDL